MAVRGIHLARMTAILCFSAGSVQPVLATGITADVGLTPPADRWIFRTQLRYMERGDDPLPAGRSIETYMIPFVLAYGVRPDWTVIFRQPILHRNMKTVSSSIDETGAGDLAIIAKYRALRMNRPRYILGIAPTVGLEPPTGDSDFSSDTWDLLTGLYLSGRRGSLGADLNLEYKVNGIDDRNGDRPGDEFTSTAAFAYQFTLDDRARTSLWPVLELTYGHRNPRRENGRDTSNSGEDFLFLSPGMKYTYQSFVIELLAQLPVHQNQRGDQTDMGVGGLLGLRYLF